MSDQVQEARTAFWDSVGAWDAAKGESGRWWWPPYKAQKEARLRGLMQAALDAFEQACRQAERASLPCYTSPAFANATCMCKTCTARAEMEAP